MLDWRRRPVSGGAVHRQHVFCSHGHVSGHVVLRPSRRVEWRQRLGQLIDAMDRSVEELGPDPPAWWRHGQPMQLTMAAVAEHVAVQEDIASVAETA